MTVRELIEILENLHTDKLDLPIRCFDPSMNTIMYPTQVKFTVNLVTNITYFSLEGPRT